jgi:hypothetical protein
VGFGVFAEGRHQSAAAADAGRQHDVAPDSYLCPQGKMPPVASAAPAPVGPAIRTGYARCSTARQELESQLVALRAAGCSRILSEKISTRVKVRPEFEEALALCWDIRTAAPAQPVILTVHEVKRLARNAAELMTLAAELQAAGIQLELLTEPLTGIYDPNGMGAMLFAVLGGGRATGP